MGHFKKHKLAKTITSLLTLLPIVSLAAETQDTAQQEQLALEKIIVTAQKRGENLQEVPLAISVLGSKQMDRGNIQNIQDIQQSVPNLSMVTTSPFTTTINMRGIPSSPNGVFNSGTSPGMGMYVDGVVYSRATGFNQELSNIERVEVLRGPQGTLFGQNTNLGVINIITKKPSDMVEGKVKVDLGNYGLRKTNLYLTGPLIEDVLAASISLFDVSRDGYVENSADGSEFSTQDRHGGRAQVRYTPTDKLTLDISAEYLKDKSIPLANKLTDYELGLGYLGLYPSGMTPEDFITDDIHEVFVNPERYFVSRENWGLDTTLSYQFDSGFEFKSITAKKVYDSTIGTDMDSTPVDIVFSTETENNEQFTQEFQILSPTDQSLRYVAGFFYLNNEAVNDQNFLSGTGIYGIPTGLPEPYPQSLNLQPGSGPINGGTLQTKSSAIFANVNYDFTQAINGFLGLRYSDVEKQMSFSQRGWETSLPGVYLLNYIDIPATNQTLKDDFLSWTVGLNGTINDNNHVYGKVSKGYKEGGYSFRPQSLQSIGGNPLNPQMSFDREAVVSYELGLKSDLFDHRMRLNMAAFYLDYSDIQTRVIDDNGTNRVVNGPSATSQGIEAELSYRVTKQLAVNAAIGYADATFDEFENCHAIDDCTGNQLPGAAKWTNSVSLNYETTLTENWDLFAGVDYSYRGKVQSDARNLSATELGTSNLVNSQIGIVSTDGTWEVMLWTKNLLDEEIEVSKADKATSELSFSDVMYAPPRTYGISFTYNFF